MKCDRCRQDVKRLKTGATKELLCDLCRTTPPLEPLQFLEAIEQFVRTR